MLDLLIGILGLIISVSITYFILDTLFLKIKLNQTIRIRNRYIKVLERKIKGSE